MARALITGITGFAGSHLAEHLLGLGDDVAGLARGSAPARNLAALAGRVRLFQADLVDVDAVAAALAAFAPDEVYHLAGFASPRLSLSDPLACWRANALGTASLFAALRRLGARPRVLVASSAEVYGHAGWGGPIPETAPFVPVTPYGASKVAAEMAALAAHETDRVPTVRVRAFNHTGPRQEPVFVAPAFAKQIAEAELGLGPREIRVGNLAPIRELGDVRDVVSAYRLILRQGSPGAVYNLASGSGTPIRGILELLLAQARVPVAVVEDPALFRPAELDALVGDGSRLEQATGFRRRWPIAETLAAVLDDWRARASEAKGAPAPPPL